MVRIQFPPAVSQANFRIAPLARPDLVERLATPFIASPGKVRELYKLGEVELGAVFHFADRLTWLSCQKPRLKRDGTLLHGSVVRRRGLDGVSGPRF